MYGKHQIVAQAFVYGDSLQSSLVSVIVPDEIPFVAWAKENGFKADNWKDLVKMKEVRDAVQKVLDQFGRDNGLKGFENAKAVYLESELFTLENGLLTPTFKLKVNDF